MKSIKAIDLFSGSGGTTQGLKKSGIEVVAAVEIDNIACKTYKYNNPEVKLFNEDIRKVTKSELSNLYDEKLDYLMLVACPPCQGFSSIRLGGEDDIRNELVFEYQRLIEELNPDFLIMENVAGMTGRKGKKIFDTFKTEISKKYNVVYDVLNSADYGVPQTRKRLVVHGIKKSLYNELKLDEFTLPTRTHSKEGGNGLSKWKNADVILDLPPIKAGESYEGEKEIYNHVANGLSETNISRIQLIREGGGSRNALPDHLILNCHRNTKGHSDVYGILDIDKPAVTITGGCMTFSKGRFGHPYQNRAISAREAARLQSFDDNHVFFGNRSQLAKQIGNAVPVKLAQASGSYFVNLIKRDGL